MVEEDLPGEARRKGAWLLDRLRRLQQRYPSVIREVRGRGLMIGLDMTHPGMGGAVMAALFRRHVLAIHTLNNERVVRLLPPLVITQAELEEGYGAIEEAVAETAALGLDD